MPIEYFESKYRLGIAALDTTHQEFVDQVNDLEKATGGPFADGFSALVAHTKLHFHCEQELMHDCAFPALIEHTDEHQRVLGEMERFARQVAEGRTHMAKAYVRESLPAWFRLVATQTFSLVRSTNRTSRTRGRPGIEPRLDCSTCHEAGLGDAYADISRAGGDFARVVAVCFDGPPAVVRYTLLICCSNP